MQEPAHSYPAAVEESKPEGAEEWADWAAVDMSSQVGIHISNDVKCEYTLANGKCDPKLGDELLLSPLTSFIILIMIGVPALLLVIVWAREPQASHLPGADRCSLEGLMQVLLSATVCVCVCACMRLILSPYLSLTFYQNILQGKHFSCMAYLKFMQKHTYYHEVKLPCLNVVWRT